MPFCKTGIPKITPPKFSPKLRCRSTKPSCWAPVSMSYVDVRRPAPMVQPKRREEKVGFGDLLIACCDDAGGENVAIYNRIKGRSRSRPKPAHGQLVPPKMAKAKCLLQFIVTVRPPVPAYLYRNSAFGMALPICLTPISLSLPPLGAPTLSCRIA